MVGNELVVLGKDIEVEKREGRLFFVIYGKSYYMSDRSVLRFCNVYKIPLKELYDKWESEESCVFIRNCLDKLDRVGVCVAGDTVVDIFNPELFYCKFSDFLDFVRGFMGEWKDLYSFGFDKMFRSALFYDSSSKDGVLDGVWFEYRITYVRVGPCLRLVSDGVDSIVVGTGRVPAKSTSREVFFDSLKNKLVLVKEDFIRMFSLLERSKNIFVDDSLMYMVRMFDSLCRSKKEKDECLHSVVQLPKRCSVYDVVMSVGSIKKFRSCAFAGDLLNNLNFCLSCLRPL